MLELKYHLAEVNEGTYTSLADRSMTLGYSGFSANYCLVHLY